MVEQSGEGYNANGEGVIAQGFHQQNNRRKDEPNGSHLNSLEGGLYPGHALDIVPNGVHKKDEQGTRSKNGHGANQSA